MCFVWSQLFVKGWYTQPCSSAASFHLQSCIQRRQHGTAGFGLWLVSCLLLQHLSPNGAADLGRFLLKMKVLVEFWLVLKKISWGNTAYIIPVHSWSHKRMSAPNSLQGLFITFKENRNAWKCTQAHNISTSTDSCKIKMNK